MPPLDSRGRPYDAKFMASTYKAARQSISNRADEATQAALTPKQAAKKLRDWVGMFSGMYGQVYREVAEEEIKARGWGDAAPPQDQPSLF